MTVEFNRLVGVNKISQELGNKNLIIKFADYKANDIERVSYDIENRQFRLTVIPKPGITAPQKEQIGLSYSGVSSDTVILVGGTNISHFPALSSKDMLGAKIVHIGTKELSVNQGKQLLSFAQPASTVSEIVATLIKAASLSLDSDIATNLLMGIEEGSNKFTSPQVTAQTFMLISELMQAGGRRQQGRSTIKATDFLPGAIPGKLPQSIQPGQTQTQPQTQSAWGQNQLQNKVKDNNKKEEGLGKAPKDWLEPKIYKGTSVS